VAGRRQRQRHDREQRILAAASALFSGRGYTETTMQEIADSANLAVGTLYNYFRTKPELLAAILRREIRGLLAAGGKILAHASPDPEEAVIELLRSYADSMASHPRKLWRELAGAAIGGPESLAAGTFEADQLLIAQIVSLLDRLHRRGALARDVEAGRLAIALYAIYFTWWNAYLVSDAMTLDELLRELGHGVRLVLTGNLTHVGAPAEPVANQSPTPRVPGIGSRA